MRPIIKIIIKQIFNNIHVKDIFLLKLEIAGRIRAISTSKIKKIMAIKKNRKEKGKREDDFWSNPHSKVVIFSRWLKDFFDKIKDIIIKILVRIIMKAEI